MKVTVYTLNAFALDDDGGNPAGVVLNADNLSEQQMQQIAKEVGFSETAFVLTSQKADLRVRFFTPVREVPLCGHATIATYHLLGKKGVLKPGVYKQETNVGVLTIEVKSDFSVLMDQDLPRYLRTVEPSLVAESLGIDVQEIETKYPIQHVSTGGNSIIVPLKKISTLQSLKPKLDVIKGISETYANGGGYHVFCVETHHNNSIAHTRNFGPFNGIPEEAATGTASGALACYLFKYGIISEEQVKHITFEQGYTMERPSEILATLDIENNEVKRVRVGGSAKNIQEKVIEIE